MQHISVKTARRMGKNKQQRRRDEGAWVWGWWGTARVSRNGAGQGRWSDQSQKLEPPDRSRDHGKGGPVGDGAAERSWALLPRSQTS